MLAGDVAVHVLAEHHMAGTGRPLAVAGQTDEIQFEVLRTHGPDEVGEEEHSALEDAYGH